MNNNRRFHIAFAVTDIAASVADYNQRLGAEPVLLVDGEYALWRTDALNVSIRRTTGETGFRHVGWEDPDSAESMESIDSIGVVWERFSQSQQLDEIKAIWPAATTSSPA